MLRSYRGIVVALLGLILAGPSYSQNRNPNQSPATSNSSTQLNRIAAPVEKLPIATAPDDGCDQGKDDRQSDLCAQWKAADAAADSANWTFWSVIAGAVGVTLGFGTLFAAWRAAHWAKKAAEHTETGSVAAAEGLGEVRKANAAQLRPYVGFMPYSDEDDEKRIDFTPEGFLRFKIKNFGNVPAKNIELHYGSDLFTAPVGDVNIGLESYYSENIATLMPGAYISTTIFLSDMPVHTFDLVRTGQKSLMLRVKVEYDVIEGVRDFDDMTLIVSKYLLENRGGSNRLTKEERNRH